MTVVLLVLLVAFILHPAWTSTQASKIWKWVAQNWSDFVKRTK